MRAVLTELGIINYLQQYHQHLPLAVLVDWKMCVGEKKKRQAIKQVKNISSE